MVLGLPPVDADKPTFYWDREVNWDEHDREGKPWDWTKAPDTEIQRASVRPICAVEFFAPLGRTGAAFTEVGDFFNTTLIVTLLRTEFNQVFGASNMTIGPRHTMWWFRYWQPQLALGGLEVFMAHFQAEDTK